MVMQNTKKADSNVKGRTIDNIEISMSETTPNQLSLFQIFLPNNKKYSNTIELYDAIPKYFSSPKQMASLRHSSRFLDVLEREFKHRGETYRLEMTPARIKRGGEGQIEYYPTMRENLIEEALRKLATDPQCGRYFDGNMGVRFTLYQLRQELKERGHSIKYPSLIESLTIANRTNLSVTKISGGKEPVLSSPIFPVLMLSNRDEWLSNPKSTYCYVQFNVLVTQSISSLTYRQFDYNSYMAFKKSLSRWLHRRMCHNYTQAKMNNSYIIKTSTIVRDSGLISDGIDVRHQIIEIEEALSELKAAGILYRHDTIKDFDGRRIIDATHELRPSSRFVDDIVNANQHQRMLEKIAHDDGYHEQSYNPKANIFHQKNHRI
jgi:hypothetical protein